ncbi:cyclic AMP-responsive element-binding protein 1-like [Watersipora subatra]|uniref:cyclic AMP-responsive element-binding protein 1-like n=1 Tax=Watersipora subatra TaxID=2589382 RepID=UPI00355C525A
MDNLGDDDNSSSLGDQEDVDNAARRELLARRPSYRKILNDLSGTGSDMMGDKIQEEDGSDDSGNPDNGNGQIVYSNNNAVVIPASAIQLTDGAGHGIQTLTMSNSDPAVSSSGTTIVQYAQGPDGQLIIPTGSAYQLSAIGGQGVVMATGGGGVGEEASRKRELRLLKNREAAKECRRKKKEYVKCLENRVAVLENQNKALIEELKSLKELYCQKDGVGMLPP